MASYQLTEIGPHKLFCGDYHALADDLPTVDALVSDPPYKFKADGAGQFRKRRKALKEIQRLDLDKGFDPSFINAFKFPSVVMFCHNDQRHQLEHYLLGHYTRIALCTWHKTNPQPVRNKHYLPDTEFYFHAWNEGHHPVGEHHDMFRHITGLAGRPQFGHPNQKPDYVMDKIIKNVNGQIILDCFMGSGSTGVAAIKAGKTFIGVERDEGHFQTCVKRVREAYEKFMYGNTAEVVQ